MADISASAAAAVVQRVSDSLQVCAEALYMHQCISSFRACVAAQMSQPQLHVLRLMHGCSRIMMYCPQCTPMYPASYTGRV